MFLYAPHPSPNNDDFEEFTEHNDYIMANEALVAAGKQPINWTDGM